MCGIAGLFNRTSTNFHPEHLSEMTARMVHRGPDGQGIWLSACRKIGLAHRRLAIIDLSEQAKQPLTYLDRYTIVHNGEVYNYLELRQQLQAMGYVFYSGSDTEVIVAAYHRYGEQCLQQFDGMFAFAIWDEQEQTLFAARDRMGEKPFYYAEYQGCFYFGSEMKALWAAGVPRSPDGYMMLQYLTHGIAKHPEDTSRTFFHGIQSLPPAHHISVSASRLNKKQYWTPQTANKWEGDIEAAAEKLSELLTVSVSRRMRSDVVVGSSMSGGIDSATIVQKILEIGNKPVVFSAIFPEFEKDESNLIYQLQQQLQATSTNIIPASENWAETISRLMHHQEEPFSSLSVFAQWKVYRTAKEHGVKVLLDGQGADEVFAGYEKYIHWYWQELWRKRRYKLLRQEQRQTTQHGINVNWGMANYAAASFPKATGIILQHRRHDAIKKIPMVNPVFLHDAIDEFNPKNKQKVIFSLNDRLLVDQQTGPLEELLRYADRNAMAHGVEVRLPFLQHEIVELLMSLPSGFKINKGYTKYLLRKLQHQRLPDSIVWQKRKTGFEPPQKKWMQEEGMRQLIVTSRKMLVQEKILQPNVLDQPLKPMDAYSADNFDWRYVCLAAFLQSGKNQY